MTSILQGPKNWLLIAFSFLFLFFFGYLDSAFACPLCKNFLSPQNAAANAALSLAKGFYWSILFMLLMPFILVGMITGLLVHSVRKANQER